MEVIGGAMQSSNNFYEIEFLDFIKRNYGVQKEINSHKNIFGGYMDLWIPAKVPDTTLSYV